MGLTETKTAAYTDLQRIASLAVVAKSRAALSELLMAGRQLDDLLVKGDELLRDQRDHQVRGQMGEMIDVLEWAAVKCRTAVHDVRTLIDTLVTLDESKWPMSSPQSAAPDVRAKALFTDVGT
jgi:hypothetical protein